MAVRTGAGPSPALSLLPRRDGERFFTPRIEARGLRVSTGTLRRRRWRSCKRVRERVQAVLVVDVDPALGELSVPHVENCDSVRWVRPAPRP